MEAHPVTHNSECKAEEEPQPEEEVDENKNHGLRAIEERIERLRTELREARVERERIMMLPLRASPSPAAKE